MNEDKYQQVVQALPSWKPTRTQRTFGVEAIQEIVGGRFIDALAMKRRLQEEQKLAPDYTAERTVDEYKSARKDESPKIEQKPVRFIEFF